MLILTRKTGEAIIINDETTIIVVGVKGHQVRLGFNAPREVSIDREEIWQRIKIEGKHRGIQNSVMSHTDNRRNIFVR